MAVTDEMVERAAIAIVNCERTHISLEPITSLEHVLPMDRPFVLEEARAALTAALSLPVSNTGEWQPMETAPISNGSNRFLAYIIGHGCCVCYAGAGRFIYNMAGERIHRATHWQPLPEAPNE